MHKKDKLHVLLIILTLIIACTKQKSPEFPDAVKNLDHVTIYSGDIKPVYDVSLKREVLYGENPNVILGSVIDGISVDVKGRIYIEDSNEYKIHIFNYDGSYLKSVGRKGRGPGEFQNIRIHRIDKDFLYVLDDRQFKLSVFDLKTLIHKKDYHLMLKDNNNPPSWLKWTQKSRLFYKPIDFFIRPDGSYFIIFGAPGIGSKNNINERTYEVSVFDVKTNRYLRHDVLSFKWTGKNLVYEHDNGMLILFDVLYKRGSEFDYSGTHLVYGWTDDLLFKFYNNEGQYERAFYYPVELVKIKQEEIVALYTKTDKLGMLAREAVRKDDLPEFWPAFNLFLIDDQKRLWLSVFTDQPETYEWWVLKESGKLITKFTWPRNRQIEVVKNDKVYVRETDPVTGLQQVVRYGFELVAR